MFTQVVISSLFEYWLYYIVILSNITFMFAWHRFTLHQKGYNSWIATPHFTGHPPFSFCKFCSVNTSMSIFVNQKHSFHFTDIYGLCTIGQQSIWFNHRSMCGMSQWFFKNSNENILYYLYKIRTHWFSLYLPSFKQEMKDSGKCITQWRIPDSWLLCFIRWQCNQCRDKWNCQSAQSSPRDDVVVDCKCGRTSGGFHPPWSQPETIRSGYWLLLILICHDSYPHKQHMASLHTQA